MSGTAVLASGGLDSSVLLAETAARGPVHPIYVRAGLPWEDEEVAALRAFAEALATTGAPVRPVVELSVDARSLYGDHWSLNGAVPGYEAPDEAVYLPGRNLMLIGLAAVWCSTHDVGAIALGTLAGNPFADATAEFFTGYAGLLSTALGHPIRIETPYRELDKAGLVRRSSGLPPGLPLGLTLTCMAPAGGVHCDACNKCRERREAFAAAGVTDTAEFADSNAREEAYKGQEEEVA